MKRTSRTIWLVAFFVSVAMAFEHSSWIMAFVAVIFYALALEE